MLIDPKRDHEFMIAFFVITLLLIVGPLAYLIGVDSRTDEREWRDRYSS